PVNATSIETLQTVFEASPSRAGWLQAVREQALRHFTASGFPTRREEAWKYTSLDPVADRSLRYFSTPQPAAGTLDTAALVARAPRIHDALRIVLLNGAVQDLPAPLPSGLQLGRLPDIDDIRRQDLEQRLRDFEHAAVPSLAALNTAFLTDVLVVDVAAGHDIDCPLHIVSITGDRPAMIGQPRIMIRLGANSHCCIIEHHISNGPTVSNTITQIDCGAGSRLEYIKVQNESDDAYHLAAQQFELGPDARLEATHLDLGASLARNDLQVRLNGRSASAALYGLFIADAHRHLDNHSNVEHCVGDTQCEEIYRGIVCDHGRGVFNGRILVHHGADGSNASLENRNLLLDRTAEVDTKPELEIYTDDVKCSHGSTTGQLDATAVFYLRSRGIPQDRARQMLTIAFAREVADCIPVAELREVIDRTIESRVGKDLSLESATP
ncbi:MAG TPA: Fe-S cluster assembly protein SufD, partial [Chromatiales bacterium]|nr:Fe-S cluster assembly protein SufD [Chromatiales bacterium]